MTKCNIQELKKGKYQEGYTLIETFTAFAILLLVLVPLISVFNTAKTGKKARQTVIASCLLEQESEYIKTFPEKALPRNTRRVNGREWVITYTASGNTLEKCVVRVDNSSGVSVESVFYRLNYEK